jgi:hypothetical protein
VQLMQEEIDQLIYRFYPKIVADQYDYYETKEYLERRKRIQAAITDKSLQSKWSQLKQNLDAMLVDRSQIIADYSFGGGSPGLHLSFSPKSFGLPNDKVIVITLIVSVISRFWAYRFTGSDHIQGYSLKRQEELAFLKRLDLLVKGIFNAWMLSILLKNRRRNNRLRGI